MTRRGFLGTGAALAAWGQGGWTSLFDGRSLTGWKAAENAATWTVADGCLACAGPRSHLFYEGPAPEGGFRNFEFEAEVWTEPLCNSGIFFHTAYQEKGWPAQGFEVQVNNSAEGEGTYRERKRTGSLYGVRNVYVPVAKDREWFRLQIRVVEKNVQVRVNGVLVVDFDEPSPAVRVANERGRTIGTGTFALQGHDAGSRARYRNLRVRPLPDGGAKPPYEADSLYRDHLEMTAANLPTVDYHVHLKGGLTLEEALKESRRLGIGYGVAINCGKGFTAQDDASAQKFVQELRGAPVFVAMQAEGREWVEMFSRQTVGLFDYVFTDSMTWTDNRGRRMRTWIKEEVGEIRDAQEFMETLVERAVGILDREPVDIYVNPTFVPDVLAPRYDELWTEARMRKVVDALKRNGVALEINNRYRLPGEAFLRMAKEAKVPFAWGTNNAGRDLGRCEYAIEMTKKLGLRWQDFFVPRPVGERAVDRKGKALRA